MSQTRVVVIGGGPGGYVAAIRASQLGAQTILIERDEIGGTCLNRGCIPTKALIESVNVLNAARQAEAFGVVVADARPDLSAMMERKNRIVVQLRQNVERLLKAHKVERIKGTATLKKGHRVAVRMDDGEEEIEAQRIILATGSRPAPIPSLDLSHPLVLTSDLALELREIPHSLIIVGGGVIGVEFAHIFHSLGARITIIEMMDRILPAQDGRVSRQMTQHLRAQGMEMRIGTSIEDTQYGDGGVTCQLQSGERLGAERLLVAAGRAPVSSDLGLELVGVEADSRKNIVVNEKMQTSIPNIFAAGDVTGKMLLAHVASAQGIVAAENALGLESTMDYSSVPTCIYTHPEVASVGLTWEQATALGSEIKRAVIPLGGIGKALVMEEGAGFVQLIQDRVTRKLLGAQIMGPQATELIHEVALAMRLSIPAEELAATVHAHPSLAEAIQEAARTLEGKAVHHWSL